MGGAFLTQSPDIERGALLVGSATFSFMIERSIHFNTYETFLMPAYEKRLVTPAMAFSQHVWTCASAAYIAEAEAAVGCRAQAVHLPGRPQRQSGPQSVE